MPAGKQQYKGPYTRKMKRTGQLPGQSTTAQPPTPTPTPYRPYTRLRTSLRRVMPLEEEDDPSLYEVPREPRGRPRNRLLEPHTPEISPVFARFITISFSLALISSIVAFHSLLIYFSTGLFGTVGDQNRAVVISTVVTILFRIVVGATGMLDMIELPQVGIFRIVDLMILFCLGLWFVAFLALGAPEVWTTFA